VHVSRTGVIGNIVAKIAPVGVEMKIEIVVGLGEILIRVVIVDTGIVDAVRDDSVPPATLPLRSMSSTVMFVAVMDDDV
jgi:hypothetical protein